MYVCMYIYVYVTPPKSLNGTSIHLFKHSQWTSRQIYRLALPFHAPETLSSLSKSRISLNTINLALFVRKDDTSTVAQIHRHLALKLALEVRALPTIAV